MEYESIEYINSDSEYCTFKCGEILSSNGLDFQINCSLCDTLGDEKWYNFDEYVQHIQLKHFNTFDDDVSVGEDQYFPKNINGDDTNDTTQPEETADSNFSNDSSPDFRDDSDSIPEKNVCKINGNGSSVLEISRVSQTVTVSRNIEKSDCSEQSENNNLSLLTVKKRNRKHTIVICEICGKNFRGEANLKYHMYTHTENNQYECDICGKSYRFPHNLLKHKQKHTNAKPFKCKFCDKRYSSKDGVSNHETKHTGASKKHKCDHCNKSFSTPGLLIQHTRIHTGEKPFICDFCEEGFISKQIMLHRHTPCPKYMELPFKCQYCSLRFETEDELLNQHKECSNNPTLSEKLQLHKCPQCPAELMSKQALSNHKKLHSAEKSFCDQCGKCFSNRSLLANHSKIHNHPYRCQPCDKGFPTEKCLIKHNEYFHNRDRPFVCDICHKTFITQCALSKHAITHSNNKRFQCNKCQKKFVNYESLYSHKKSHADRVPCRLCGKILNALYIKNHKCQLKQLKEL